MRGILEIMVHLDYTRDCILMVDSPHLRYVSGPLSREGISILYQSSYFCDYLLCKSEDFDKVATIFVSQGCTSPIYVDIGQKLMIRAGERRQPNPEPKTIRPLHPSLVHFRPIPLFPNVRLSTSITHPYLSRNYRPFRPTSLCGFRKISREGM
jgi:hypothetical protein